MNPLRALSRLATADLGARDATASLAIAHEQFGESIATARRIPRAAFAKKLGVSGQMLALMESGRRRWPLKRAELAVKLLTRREDWPD